GPWVLSGIRTWALARFAFFFQAEDGIRDFHVTGVQTCALPISNSKPRALSSSASCSQASALRLDTTTLAPQRASSSTMERPMPLVEPVTRATLPVRSNNGLLMVCLLLLIPVLTHFQLGDGVQMHFIGTISQTQGTE